jgi:hypothetical protein
MQSRLLRRILLIVGLLVVVLVAGTVGFVFIEGYPWLDAFYMTLTTITTVGYGRFGLSATLAASSIRSSSSSASAPSSWRAAP